MGKKAQAPVGLTDEEMAAHEAPPPPSGGGLTDEEMAAHEATPETNLSAAGRVAHTAFGTLGKLANYLRAGTTGPITAKIVTGDSHYGEGLDPRNLDQFPSNAELFKKAGWPNPALSDVVPGYAEPGQGGRFRPEKGGMLDPTAAGALQVVTDPAMYLGLGEAKAAAAGLPKVAKALAMTDQAVNPISMATRRVGRGLYESPLLPLEQMGNRKGKEKIAETLYQGGVKTPFNLPTKAQAIVDELMAVRDSVFKRAEQAGGRASQAEAVAPLQARIRAIRASRDPELQPIADKMERKVEEYLKIERPTPAVPDRVEQVASPILDEGGRPFTHEVVTPGTPEIPGKVVTPAESSAYKSSIYRTQPVSHYDIAGVSPAEAELNDLLARGQLQSSQTAVRKSLGDEAASKVEDLNQRAGNLLSTQKAQNFVKERSERQLHQLREISPADLLFATIGGGAGMSGGVHTSIEGAAAALALKKLGGAANMSRMPVGYALRKLGETQMLDRLNALIQQSKGRN